MVNAVGRIAGRILGSLVAVGAVLIVLASPAGADGVVPTNYRSVIDSVAPHQEGLRVEVVGEDSFLQVTAQPGVTVEVPGYDGEPYLRITRNGTVERNRNSSSSYINESRSGRVSPPPGVGTKADPDWERIATGGSIAWHDHRIHYMATGTPKVDSGGLVQTWEVPLVVNGKQVTVSGSLYRYGNVVPWAALVAVAAAVAAVLTVRRHGQRWAMPVVVLAGVLALVVSASISWLNPPGSGASWLPIVLPVLAIFAGLATRLVSADRQPMLRLAPLLAAVACLLGWVVPIIGVMWMPNIPSLLPEAAVRVAVSLVLGATLGAATAVLVWPTAALNRNVAAEPDSSASR